MHLDCAVMVMVYALITSFDYDSKLDSLIYFFSMLHKTGWYLSNVPQRFLVGGAFQTTFLCYDADQCMFY